MDISTDAFLSTAEADRLSLFKIIKERVHRINVLTQSDTEKEEEIPEISSVNLRDVAKNMDKNYGSIYNSYTQIIDDFKKILDMNNPTDNDIFTYDTDRYLYYLTSNSLSFKFIRATLLGEKISLDEFLDINSVSKATAMRHFKPMRMHLKTYGVRMVYGTIGFVGDELLIRLALTSLLWAATNGTAWPFSSVDYQEIDDFFHHAIRDFGFTEINPATSELFRYFITVSLLRVSKGYILEHDARFDLIDFPYPPIVKNFFNEAKGRAFQEAPDFPELVEAAGLYITLNILPFNHENIKSVDFLLKSFKHYAPSIYGFVEDFMRELPPDMVNDFNLSVIEKRTLKLNLNRVFAGVQALGKYYLAVMADFYDEGSIFIESQDKKTEDVVIEAIDRLKRYGDAKELSQSEESLIIEVFYQVLKRQSSYNRGNSQVNVAINATTNSSSYTDLYSFLKNFDFVNLQKFADIDETTDVIVSGNANTELDNEPTTKAVAVRVDSPISSSDLGIITVLLVRIWRNKVLKRGQLSEDSKEIDN